MNFNNHSNLEGLHAFLSPSKYHWVNYDDEKFDLVFTNKMAAQRGVELHNFAFDAIRLGVKLPDVGKTLNMYVNDAIGYRMTPEQMLYYSPNAFGTADAISFRDNTLRIHDLKTGYHPASFGQLEVYAAFFCLEYMYKPTQIDIQMRIYQNDEVVESTADPVEITHVMDRAQTFSKRLDILREEVTW